MVHGQLASLSLGSGGLGHEWVKGGGGQHGRWCHGEIKWHHWSAVPFVESDAGNFVVLVRGDIFVFLAWLLAVVGVGGLEGKRTYVEQLTRVVAGVDGVLVLARIGE